MWFIARTVDSFVPAQRTRAHLLTTTRDHNHHVLADDPILLVPAQRTRAHLLTTTRDHNHHVLADDPILLVQAHCPSKRVMKVRLGGGPTALIPQRSDSPVKE